MTLIILITFILPRLSDNQRV